MELDRLSSAELGCGLGTSLALGTVAAGTTYGVMRVAGALFWIAILGATDH